MKPSDSDDLSQLSMLDLFRAEAEVQTGLLMNGLLEWERGEHNPVLLESLMRAAHSLKGAARIINVPAAISVAHAMEDCFVAAQKHQVRLGQPEIDSLLRGVDLLARIAKGSDAEMAAWETQGAGEIEEVVTALRRIHTPLPPQTSPEKSAPAKADDAGGEVHPLTTDPALPVSAPETTTPDARPLPDSSAKAVATTSPATPERVLRLNADNLNRLLGLAGESLVESRWLRPFSESMQRLKRMHSELEDALEEFRDWLREQEVTERTSTRINHLLSRAGETRRFLGERLEELDLYDRRSAHLSNRLYLEVLRTRMRPFSDGVGRFPRMVRDLARSLGKQVRLEIAGENTQVDRDILERLETPLAHLLRNAVDHGCEPPEQRSRAGKPLEAVVHLEARHSAGMLLVLVSDDGSGVDLDRVRRRIVERKLTTPDVAAKLTEDELLEFLFLPGFTVRDTVTEISGRGVGLDVVQNLVKGLRGSVRVASQPGKGVRFHLQLPLTLSVLRTLLVEISGEPYAIPLAQIAHTLLLPRGELHTLEGRPHFRLGNHQVGLVSAPQVLDVPAVQPRESELPVVILGDRGTRYGLVVDRFLGERELVVQPLDARLGKVKDISAAALMEDGSPALIIDVEDLMQSVEKLVAGGSITMVPRNVLQPAKPKHKRVLAVDDSLTVRELERKLLGSRGYQTDVAVDGTDAWNALRHADYQLVITDVDMPRMDGIELTRLIKNHPQLKTVPVMIVSYKDREEDRLRGLEAGADYYLTKGSFHEETLLQAVADLIGEPES